MKLKKPMTVKARPSAPAASPAAGGGATIADRFKLDAPPAAAAARTVNKTAAIVALVAGLAALALSGFLAYTLYDHWEFLKPSTSFANA